jgi:hypothetical protein
MPLLDHFHPPLSVERHWESFHAFWAGTIASVLNDGRLPSSFYAEIQTHVGPRVEIDVATLDQSDPDTSSGGAATATLTAPEQVSAAPALVMPAAFPDDLEVLLFNNDGGPRLVSAIELVSPGNKDRTTTRRAFAVKCASYLVQGVGLVIVDVVTNRQANFHEEIRRLLELGEEFRFPVESALYTVSYRPVLRGDTDQIDVWPEAMALSRPLPTVPLPIKGYGIIPLDLEVSYTDARRHLRLD